MEPRLRSLLGGPIHGLKCVTECVEMQELEVVQAIVLFIILVEVAADKVGEMDKAGVNEGGRGVAEDDRLELRDRIKDSKLNEVGDKLEPARREAHNQLPPWTSLQAEINTDNNRLSVSGLMFWSENILGFVLFAM